MIVHLAEIEYRLEVREGVAVIDVRTVFGYYCWPNTDWRKSGISWGWQIRWRIFFRSPQALHHKPKGGSLFSELNSCFNGREEQGSRILMWAPILRFNGWEPIFCFWRSLIVIFKRMGNGVYDPTPLVEEKGYVQHCMYHTVRWLARERVTVQRGYNFDILGSRVWFVSCEK